jgi:hypothetical protein
MVELSLQPGTPRKETEVTERKIKLDLDQPLQRLFLVNESSFPPCFIHLFLYLSKAVLGFAAKLQLQNQVAAMNDFVLLQQSQRQLPGLGCPTFKAAGQNLATMYSSKDVYYNVYSSTIRNNPDQKLLNVHPLWNG